MVQKLSKSSRIKTAKLMLTSFVTLKFKVQNVLLEPKILVESSKLYQKVTKLNVKKLMSRNIIEEITDLMIRRKKNRLNI